MKWSKPELVLLSGKAAVGTCSCEQGNKAQQTMCGTLWQASHETEVICDNGSAAVPACAEGGAFDG